MDTYVSVHEMVIRQRKARPSHAICLVLALSVDRNCCHTGLMINEIKFQVMCTEDVSNVTTIIYHHKDCGH